MNKIFTFIRNWKLPIAMLIGGLLYFVFDAIVPEENESDFYYTISHILQPTLIFSMLFLSFLKVEPKNLKPHRWHGILLLTQGSLFVLCSLAALYLPTSINEKILWEGAMLCFICPTAAAAGVITRKIGGSLPGIMTYLVLADALACLLIPLMIPMVHPSLELHFWASFWQIVRRVFSILVLPCFLAWTIRYLLPGVQRWLARFVDAAFYIWGICLTMAMSLATYALVTSGIGVLVALGIGAVSLASCLLQFVIGRRVARRYGRSETVTSGQALGQKNTAFIIWLGFNYMTPVTSVAGGLYAIWQNLVNAWELSRE